MPCTVPVDLVKILSIQSALRLAFTDLDEQISIVSSSLCDTTELLDALDCLIEDFRRCLPST
jgi:hypothetical protein